MKASLRFLTVVSASVWSACSPAIDVQLIPYPWAVQPAPKSADCYLPIYEVHEPRPRGCSEVGDVFVGDTGGTWFCGRERMVAEIRQQGCALGADAAHIVRVVAPSGWYSACYEIRAALLTCAAAAQVSARR